MIAELSMEQKHLQDKANSKNAVLVERQQIFTDWLKEVGLYNPVEDASTMNKMFRVWEMIGIDDGYFDEPA